MGMVDVACCAALMAGVNDCIDLYCHKFFCKVGQPFSSAFPKAKLVPDILAVYVPPSA
jgi:hypothetical protein